jgi:hypothetical protein
MESRYLDDLIVGDRFTSGGMTLTEAEIIDFAFRYDPQPFHLDVNAAAESPYGGLIASGFPVHRHLLPAVHPDRHLQPVEHRLAWSGRTSLAGAGAPRRHPAQHRGSPRSAPIQLQTGSGNRASALLGRQPAGRNGAELHRQQPAQAPPVLICTPP